MLVAAAASWLRGKPAAQVDPAPAAQGIYPGQATAFPGQAGAFPGQAVASPGQATAFPGQAVASPGQDATGSGPNLGGELGTADSRPEGATTTAATSSRYDDDP
jgi:hypothetical protein